MFSIRNYKFTYTQILAFTFLLIIILGSICLMQPFATRSGVRTPFINALFTATSATCVTGLVVVDTFSYWSLFGQIVILLMIQVGGLGFMTFATLFSMLLRRRIGLKERKLLMESANTVSLAGVVRLFKRILIGTLVFEGIGALLLCFRFCPEMGLAGGVYNAVFHSVSAFCNAGFDLMGKFGPFSSFTRYSSDVLLNAVIMSLIVIGGLGFIVWDDIIVNRFAFQKYHLHTKIVLTATLALIAVGAVLFALTEGNNLLAAMGVKEKILTSLFHSVTPRTAGFNTVDVTKMTNGSSFLTMILMTIGGSPGSTAGGLKTTTLVVLILGATSSAMNMQHLNVYKRRLEDNALKKASAIATIYLSAAIVAVIAICMLQPFALEDVLFEVLSAIGTVGLTRGITPALGAVPKVLLAMLMFGGRVGSLSMVVAFTERRAVVPLDRPVEKISIG